MAKIHVHRIHRAHTGGLKEIEVRGKTVRECLDCLIRIHPEMGEAIFDPGGSLIPGLEIYVNFESAYPDELGRPVGDRDEIHVALLPAGG